MQAKQGIEDSPDFLYEDIMRVGRYSNRQELVRLFVDNVLEAYNKLLELGVECYELSSTGGHSVARAHKHNPMQVQETLYNQVKKRGVLTLFNSRADNLVVDPLTGRVLGVKTRGEGKKEVFLKGNVTVLATGGMCGNPEMIERYFPRQKALACCVELGRDRIEMPLGLGDGYKMAMAIGADTTHMYSFTMYTGIPHPENPRYSKWSGRPWFPSYREGAIAVNKEGKRFIEEATNAPCWVGEAMVMQTDKTLFKICDSTIWKKMTQGAGELKLIEEEKSYLWFGDTIEELATKARIDTAGLEETVENYNYYVDQGVDSEFGRPKEFLARIDTCPFLANQNWLAPLHNSGGLKTNKRLQILNVYGETIPGLYGAGEVIGGISGEVYLSTTHYPAAMTFGYLVGKEFATKEALA
jgi:fumarate reductase flavoprotein subunit